MTTDRRRFALAALLAVLVVATAAAGVDGTGGDGSGDLSSSTESGVGFGSNTGVGSGNGTGIGLSPEGGPGGQLLPTFIIKHAIAIVLVLSVTIPIVYTGVLLWQEGVGAVLEYVQVAVKRLAMAAIGLLALLVFFLFLSQLLGDGGGGLGGPNSTPGSFVGDAPDGQSISLTSLPIPLVIVAALGVVVAFVVVSERSGSTSVIAAALAGGAREASRVVHDTDRNVPGPRVRFEDVEPTNEVYRAWLDLARSADATDAAHTPGEVAARAIERGLDADAVSELTGVFREVRYSGDPPTAERERQAQRAAERITRDDDDPDV